jgi:hypothetical protein
MPAFLFAQNNSIDCRRRPRPAKIRTSLSMEAVALQHVGNCFGLAFAVTAFYSNAV